MKRSKTVFTSLLLTTALLRAEIAVASDMAAAAAVHLDGQSSARRGEQEQGPPQRGQTRRISQRTCNIVGVVVGIAAGLLLGNRRDSFNEGAALIGGLGSTLICGAIRWRSVAPEDQNDVNERVAEMTLDPNQTRQSYTSQATGKTYTITAGTESWRTGNNDFTTIEEVEAPQRGYKVSVVPFQVNAAVLNLRATPGSETSDHITGHFYRNDIVQSLSESPDGQWVLVGFEDVGYGWVARRYLLPVTTPLSRIQYARPAPRLSEAEIAAASAPPPPPPPPPRQTRRGRTRAPAAVARAALAYRRLTVVPPTRTARVRTQMACRAYTVTDGGRADSNRSCQASQGRVQMG